MNPLRRTNSTSSIPLPNKRNSRSSSLSRLSKPSTTTKSRDVSTEKMPRYKQTKSLFPSSRPQSLLTPQYSSSKLSIGVTPTLAVPRSARGSIFSSGKSPSSSRKRSPFKVDERPTGDKKWVSQQISNVEKYFQQYPASDVTRLPKPLSINMFIHVMDWLLKQIVPNIKITGDNYNTIVFSTLKTLGFPGTLSNSTLKAVNTMHGFPQVINIFGWLVDLINTVESIDCVVDNPKYQSIMDIIVEAYMLFNNEGQAEDQNLLSTKFAQVYNVDLERINRLRQSSSELTQFNEKQEEHLKSARSTEEETKNEMNRLRGEINDFVDEKNEKLENHTSAIGINQSRQEKLKLKIQEKKDNINNLEEILLNQQCSTQRKKAVEQDIEKMKETIDLKMNSNKMAQTYADDWTSKLNDAQKQLTRAVYEYNERLFTLSSIHPELNIHRLNVKDSESEEFSNILSNLEETIQTLAEKDICTIVEKNHLLEKIQNENISIQKDLSDINGEIENVDRKEQEIAKQLEAINGKSEMLIKKRKDQKYAYEEELQCIQGKSVNIEQSNKSLNDLIEKMNTIEMRYNRKAEMALDFWVELRESILNGLLEKNKIRDDIYEKLSHQLAKIHACQTDLVKDLETLGELQED